MPVNQTTDINLLVETAKNPCIILKYHSYACGEPCDRLVPVFEGLSELPQYSQIAFFQINADNNPVAKNFILHKKAPIVTIYHKGRLLESRSANTKDEMVELLNLLLNQRNKVNTPEK